MFFFVWQLISVYRNILWFACQVNPGYHKTNGKEPAPSPTMAIEEGLFVRTKFLQKKD